MTAESDLEHVAAAERHNRLAKQIVSEIVYAPICDGSDACVAPLPGLKVRRVTE